MTDGFFDTATRKLVADEAPPELKRDDIWQDARYAFHLVGRYLRAEPVVGSFLIGLRLFLAIAGSYTGLHLQTISAHLTDALIGRRANAVWLELTWLSLMFLAQLMIYMIITLAEFIIRIRWRALLTTTLIRRWLGDNRFYFMERNGKIDHPEQRIQEDLMLFPDLLLQLAPNAISSFASLFLYAGTLWGLSGILQIHSGGFAFGLNGYMVYAAIGSAVVWTYITHLFGRPITRVEVVRQRLEASFRHDIAKIRENAEGIAFENGVQVETSRLAASFGMIRKNWWHYTFYQTRLSGVGVLQDCIILVLPTLLCIPRVLSGQMSVGNMGLVAASFVQVYFGIAFLASSYVSIAQLRTSVVRIKFFEAAMATPAPSGIGVHAQAQTAISVRDLVVVYPDGRVMFTVGDLTFAKGDRVLIRGQSGAGKSTFLRAIAGLWPYGAGEVTRPAAGRMMFLPQRSYMPDGTLAALLSYPQAPVEDDETYAALLETFGLRAHLPMLHEHAAWRHILSPGEQQRIAAVRAVLRQPDFLFLDEASSALDTDLETQLYERLIEALPDAAIISVAHRPNIAIFHKDILEICGDKVVRRPVRAAALHATFNV
jgi:putative ATP-binding cassette transporter